MRFRHGLLQDIMHEKSHLPTFYTPLPVFNAELVKVISAHNAKAMGSRSRPLRSHKQELL